MTQITLSDEQSRLLDGASMPIVVFDSRGRKVCEIAAVEGGAKNVNDMSDDEWVAETKRRMAEDDGTRYTTAEVLAYLRTLKPE